MKKRLNKLLSLILALALTLSALSVLSFAEEDSEDETEEPETRLIINRGFDEGWELSNGLGYSPKGHLFEFDYEEGDNFNYNYFVRITPQTEQDGFLQLSFTPYNIEEGTAYLYMSIKTDDYATDNMQLGYMRLDKATGKTIYLFTITDNNLMCLDGSMIGPACNNEWYNIVLKYDFYAGDSKNSTLSVYTVDSFDDPTAEMTPVVENYDTGWAGGIEIFRFGLGGRANRATDQSWCLDNFCAYTTTGKDRVDVSGMGYGEEVDTNKAKTVSILSYSDEKTTADYLNNAFAMKVGVDYALERNVRVPLFDGEYGAPVKVDGRVYLPLLPVMDYLQYTYNVHADGISYDISDGTNTTFLTVGRQFVTINGNRIGLTAPIAVYTDPDTGGEYIVIAKEDVETLFPGYYLTWDDMGLIIISDYAEKGTDKAGNEIITNTDIVSRSKNLDTMLIIMKKFIYDYPTGEEVYADVKEHTNGFEHPYLMADQDQFDYLHEAYLAAPGDENYDANLKSQIEAFLSDAYGIYVKYADFDSNGDYLGKKKEAVNPYHEDGGYRYDGRLNEAEEYAIETKKLAMAYQITRDVDYAKAAYDYLIDLGNWDHWGPNHFLNCAGAMHHFALAFDWLYNIFEELGKDTFILAEMLYVNGVEPGSRSNSYAMTANNWNAVCSAGTTIAALALLPYSADNGYPQCADWEVRRNLLLKNNLYNLGNYGLNEYIPDGSYPEGPGYWSYATNNVFRMCAALDSAAGDNYGYMDTWAFDTTCYYALHSERNLGASGRPYAIWNYGDGDYGGQDTSLFNYVSRYYGDTALAAIRSVHIMNGKAVTLEDLLFYQKVDPNAKIELPLDYHMESIDGATTRSSWELGAIYAGILGGANNASHQDIDSGTFVYNAGGVLWFPEFGSDDYNVFEYFGYTTTRFKYFRKNAEGQSIVFMTSMQEEIPYGQVYDAKGTVTSWMSNEYGSATVIDNTEVYGGYALSAKRGMLMTNNRQTVVIQDEITLNSMQRLVWTGLTRGSTIIISRDGKTATLSYGGKFLRVTMLSANKELKFTTRDCVNEANYFLDVTLPIDSHKTLGKNPQYERASYKRLIIDAGYCMQFNVAVVIEYMGSSMANAPDVGYSWTNMHNWVPTKEPVIAATGDNEGVVKAKITDYATQLEQYTASGVSFSDYLGEYYDKLVKIDRIMLFFTPSELNLPQQQAYRTWLEHVELYNQMRDFVQSNSSTIQGISQLVSGLY